MAGQANTETGGAVRHKTQLGRVLCCECAPVQMVDRDEWFPFEPRDGAPETCDACMATVVVESEALQVARGLGEMAAWLREHPDFPISTGFAFGRQEFGMNRAAAQAEFIRRGEEMGAAVSRPYGSVSELRLEREFAGGVTLHLDASGRLFDEPPREEVPLPAELQRFVRPEASAHVDVEVVGGAEGSTLAEAMAEAVVTEDDEFAEGVPAVHAGPEVTA